MTDRDSALQTAFYLRQFITDLASSDVQTRRFAASALSEYADYRSIAALLSCLNDDDNEISTMVAVGIGNIINKIGDDHLPDCRLVDAMSKFGAAFSSSGEPHFLRPLAAAITSSCPQVAAVAVDFLSKLDTQGLLVIAEYAAVEPAAARVWEIIRGRYLEPRRDAADCLIRALIDTRDTYFRQRMLDLILESRSPLTSAAIGHLLDLASSSVDVLSKIGLEILAELGETGAILEPQIITDAAAWVRSNAGKWLLLCACDEGRTVDLLTRIQNSHEFADSEPLGDNKSFRECMASTLAAESVAVGAKELVSTVFALLRENPARWSNTGSLSAIVVLAETAAGLTQGDIDFATSLLIDWPNCLEWVREVDVIVPLTSLNNPGLEEMAWQRLQQIASSLSTPIADDIWAEIICGDDPRSLRAFKLLVGASHVSKTAEAAAWKIVTASDSEALIAMLVGLLAHTRTDVRLRAFRALHLKTVPTYLLARYIGFAVLSPDLDEILARYGANTVWDAVTVESDWVSSSSDDSVSAASAFRTMIKLDEVRAVDAFFSAMGSGNDRLVAGALNTLFATYQYLTLTETKRCVHSMLLVMNLSDFETAIPLQMQSWHDQYMADLQPDIIKMLECRLVLMGKYGTPGQIVLALNRIDDRPDGARSLSGWMMRMFENWRTEPALAERMQQVEAYLMGLRAVKDTPTPIDQLLQPSAEPTEPLQRNWSPFRRGSRP